MAVGADSLPERLRWVDHGGYLIKVGAVVRGSFARVGDLIGINVTIEDTANGSLRSVGGDVAM